MLLCVEPAGNHLQWSDRETGRLSIEERPGRDTSGRTPCSTARTHPELLPENRQQSMPQQPSIRIIKYAIFTDVFSTGSTAMAGSRVRHRETGLILHPAEHT